MGSLGVTSRTLGVHLGRSWCHLGRFGGLLGASWGPSWGVLGAIWGVLGAFRGGLGAISGSLEAYVGDFGVKFEAIGGRVRLLDIVIVVMGTKMESTRCMARRCKRDWRKLCLGVFWKMRRLPLSHRKGFSTKVTQFHDPNGFRQLAISAKSGPSNHFRGHVGDLGDHVGHLGGSRGKCCEVPWGEGVQEPPPPPPDFPPPRTPPQEFQIQPETRRFPRARRPSGRRIGKRPLA